MQAEKSERVLWPLVGAVALLFVVLVLRLWQLQVVKGGQYGKLSVQNRLRIEPIPAPRGIIYDRNGKPLVKNSPYFSASLLPAMAAQADIAAIAELLGMEPEAIADRISRNTSPLHTIKLKEGLTFKEVAAIEARLSDYPGLTIDAEQTRHYIYGDVGGHLIGYLGRMTPRQAADPEYAGVLPQSFVGQWGIEKLHDPALRGTPGRRVIEVDALGRQLRVLGEEPPLKGSDLYLSIDINLQKAAEEAFGSRAGAMAAIKPTTGEVLGLVSRPSFDPNLFSRGIGPTDWQRLARGERFPLLNRALQSQYPPGSTFKIITAIAALESGAVTPKTEFVCRGKLRRGRWSFGCWKKGGHGRISLHRALVESCDIYFYKAGEKTGIDTIARYARAFGLGSPTNVPLVRERAGLVPDRQWKLMAKGEPWYLGETYNASIGQGYVLATPMQLARMVGVVANGGYMYDLKLTRSLLQPSPSSRVEVSPHTLAVIKNALAGVVNERRGTGRRARGRHVEVSGKTGTAQVVSLKNFGEAAETPEKFRDHAWFVAYAPKEDPEIALSVFVEHGGHGGEAAAPIAKKAIDAYMKSLQEHSDEEDAEDRPQAAD